MVVMLACFSGTLVRTQEIDGKLCGLVVGILGVFVPLTAMASSGRMPSISACVDAFRI
jgi:hypothetical protein